MKVASPVLKTKVDGKLIINAHFGKSELFAVFDTETSEVEVFENPGLVAERGRGIYIAKALSERGVSAVLVKEIGHGAFEKLKQFSMKIYLVPNAVKFFEEAVEMFKNGKLAELEEPSEDKIRK
jgi:predicted Fe-Mo cluster-binding NifX family protein